MSILAIPHSLSRPTSLSKEIGLVFFASCFIALFAKVQIVLPFTPVPIVLQDLLCVACGVLFGSRRGAAIALAFLAQGAIGLPVFAGGAGGLAIFTGLTGGYLIGYVLAAFTAGWVIERFGRRTPATAFIGIVVGNALLFLCGVSYLSMFVGFSKAIVLGFLPFIPGNLIKTILIVQLLKRPAK